MWFVIVKSGVVTRAIKSCAGSCVCLLCVPCAVVSVETNLLCSVVVDDEISGSTPRVASRSRRVEESEVGFS